MVNDSGELILITGGARGIGRGLVEHFADRGRFVVFCDTDREQGEALQETCGENVRFVYADVSQEEDVRALLRATLAWKGRLNGLINNAGIADPETGPVESLLLADWQRRLDVNLTGPVLVTKHAVPHLRQTRGSIVNMASTRALQSEPDTEAYAATKGGIVALSHALAISLGPDIRSTASARAGSIPGPGRVKRGRSRRCRPPTTNNTPLVESGNPGTLPGWRNSCCRMRPLS